LACRSSGEKQRKERETRAIHGCNQRIANRQIRGLNEQRETAIEGESQQQAEKKRRDKKSLGEKTSVQREGTTHTHTPKRHTEGVDETTRAHKHDPPHEEVFDKKRQRREKRREKPTPAHTAIKQVCKAKQMGGSQGERGRGGKTNNHPSKMSHSQLSFFFIHPFVTREEEKKKSEVEVSAKTR
jgi:hypothetical protein